MRETRVIKVEVTGNNKIQFIHELQSRFNSVLAAVEEGDLYISFHNDYQSCIETYLNNHPEVVHWYNIEFVETLLDIWKK